MDPQQTPRPPVQKPPTTHPQNPPPSVQRNPLVNNNAINGPRPQNPDDRALNPNPHQQPRPAVPFGSLRPSGAPPPRNVFLQRPPGPRPSPPGAPYPNQGGPRFPPPGQGIRDTNFQGQFQHNPANSPSPGSGQSPNSPSTVPPRPPYPGQRPPENQARFPLSRNPSLSQEDTTSGPKQFPQNRLQRNDSNSSVNEQKFSRDKPPRILIDKTMTDFEEEKQNVEKSMATKPPEPQRKEVESADKARNETDGSKEKTLVNLEKAKIVNQREEDSNKMEQERSTDNDLTAHRNLVPPASPDSVKGFDNGERRSLSSKTASREESPKSPRSPNSPKVTDDGRTQDQNKKRAQFSEDTIEIKEKSKPDRKTWSSTDRSPRNSAKDIALTLSIKPGDTTDVENDSGVDESTQKKEGPTTNGVSISPTKKTSVKSRDEDKRSAAGSPVKSPCKNSKSLPRTPDSTSSNSLQEKKKVPMNKVQVGAAPSPNLKTVKSKIGSLDNASYKPGGGKVKIENRKLDFSKAQPKIAAKNDKYTPSGGDKKIRQVKLQWNAKPKVGSLENATYKPGGGDKKIETVKLDFKDKAKPKVGSKDNAKHVPGGGSVKSPTSQPKTPQDSPKHIETQKVDIKAESKIGSLDNMKHKPGGGDKKIFNDKDYLRQTSSSNAESVSGSGSQSPIPSGTINDGKNELPT